MAECRRVIERPDGVSVVAPARADQQPGETEVDWCRRAFQHAIDADPSLKDRPFHDVDSAAIPADRTNRNKWRYTNGQVKVDPTAPDPPKSIEQRRKAACLTIEFEGTASPGLKELCDTF